MKTIKNNMDVQEKSQTSGLMECNRWQMMDSHKNPQCQYLIIGSIGSSASCLHTCDDFMNLVLCNSVPFNDEHIFSIPAQSRRDDDSLEFVCLTCPKLVR